MYSAHISRPTQSIIYIPLQVNRFQKNISLIVEYKYLYQYTAHITCLYSAHITAQIVPAFFFSVYACLLITEKRVRNSKNRPICNRSLLPL